MPGVVPDLGAKLDVATARYPGTWGAALMWRRPPARRTLTPLPPRTSINSRTAWTSALNCSASMGSPGLTSISVASTIGDAVEDPAEVDVFEDPVSVVGEGPAVLHYQL